MAVGFLLFLWTWNHLSRGTFRNRDYFSSLLVVLIISGLGGARAAYVAEHWTSEFAGDPITALYIHNGGLMFYGGLLSAWLALTVFALAHKERLLEFFDLIVTAVPIGHAIGRVGCFLQGCCFGDRTDSSIGVRYPFGSYCWAQQRSAGMIPDEMYYGPSLPVYPSQLLEALLCAAIYAILFRHYKRRKYEGEQLVIYGALYPVARFFIEMMRADPRMAVGPFSISQSISVALMLFSLALAIYIRYRGHRAEPIETDRNVAASPSEGAPAA